MLAPTLLDLELAVLVLAQVVFRATELLGLIRHPSADFKANMIESTKVVIRGYGETFCCKDKVAECEISHLLIFLGSRDAACLLPACYLSAVNGFLHALCHMDPESDLEA